MSTRMLIDARHNEETRVAIVKGSRVEDFDYESAAKRQLKGNVYLARITRVEPSLQAAFVEYGGNRHGFLAFSEIHPDYYQIPAEDREELLKLEHEAELAEAEAALKLEENGGQDSKKSKKSATDKKTDSEDDSASEDNSDSKAEAVAQESVTKEINGDEGSDDADSSSDDSQDAEQAEEIEAAGRRRNMRALKRRYKIQEVIKRRQVVLVQVVKEERGNKGAALTTYVSLAGRYCVLMPNSTHSGGISRKISNVADRKRLKSMMTSLNLPQGMGCIVRTAGMARTKSEVKRDLDYLLRLWNGIRELTLKSVAPASIYEEGNLIKRSIRDLLSKDIDEILVEGNEGYQVAKDFITMLMPNHAKKVQHYKEGAIPLFNRYQVESQLEAMYNPNVQLKSGGYIVINPTEALISVDVNSGRATKEKNIEETAVKTNLEAAEELGRQLRLRDMAGLIVIDFIDMEDRGNNRAVERRLKDVLKSDRARIQVGRISSFGLLEMSRQRLRPNLLEASMMVCAHCDGSGVVRNVESAALQALRALEDEGIRGRSAHLKVSLNRDVAIYTLNKKRADIFDLEKRYALTVEIHGRRDLGPSDMEVERENITPVKTAVTADAIMTQSIIMDPIEIEEDDAPKTEEREPRTRTRRRRSRRGRGGDRAEETVEASADTSETVETPENVDASAADESEKPKSRRRRGRRGGRRRKGAANVEETAVSAELEGAAESKASESGEKTEEASPVTAAPVEAPGDNAEAKAETADKPKRPRRRRSKKTEEARPDAPASEATADSSDATEKKAEVPAEAADTAEVPADKPKRARRPRRTKKDDADKPVEAKADSEVATPKADEAKAEAAPAEDKPKPARRRRTKKADSDEKPVTEAKAEPAQAEADKADAAAESKPKRARPRKAASAKTESVKAETEKADAPKAEPKKEAKPKAAPAPKETVSKEAAKETPKEAKPEAKSDAPPRSGWWNKTFG